MDYAWRRWSRSSYGGRRSSRSMKARLEDYPIPTIQLPDWVTTPEKFAFPVSSKEVEGWNPVNNVAGKSPRADSALQ